MVCKYSLDSNQQKRETHARALARQSSLELRTATFVLTNPQDKASKENVQIFQPASSVVFHSSVTTDKAL